MRVKQILRVGAVAAWALALAPMLPTFGTAASGATLDASGWWNRNQALPVSGDPTGLGLTTVPTVPGPATVPEDPHRRARLAKPAHQLARHRRRRPRPRFAGRKMAAIGGAGLLARARPVGERPAGVTDRNERHTGKHEDRAQRTNDAYWLVMGFTVAIFILVEGLLVAFVVQYRARGRSRTIDSDRRASKSGRVGISSLCAA